MAKKTQAQIEFKAVTSEFTGGIKEVNSSLKTMQNELKLNSAELKNNGDDADLLAKRQQVLQRQYDATSQKIELTQRSLEEAKRVLGENSTEYRNLENALLRAKTAQQNIQAEINQTSRKLEGLDDSAKEAEGGFNKLDGAMAVFGGETLSNATSKIGELAGQLMELNEETKEFRMNLAKLDGSTSQYGYSTEFTNQKMKEMYGYFQDDQVAVNTISNLQGLGLSEEELTNTLNAGIGVWTAYGDSIPIEGLTESINESAQVSKVTGSLADALNWAGISEDDFNAKLEKCNSTKERAQLITDTLNGAYGKSKDTYDENTESLRKNNEANYDLIKAQADLGEALEPVDTALTNLKVGVLQAISPVIVAVAEGFNGLITAFQGLPGPVQATILTIAGVVLAIVSIIAVAGIISSVWGILTGIFSAGIAVFTAVGGVIAGLSAPVLIAVAVVSSLIAIGITLYKNWDKIKAKATQIWEGITNTISTKIDNAKNAVKKAIDAIKGFFNFKFSWPKISLPHFSISPPGWKIGDLLKGSIPRLNIKWLAKGGIMTQPTLFGGGEKGNEAILPLDGFYNYLDNKLDSANSTQTIDYDKLTKSVVSGLKEVGIYMSDKRVGQLVAKEVGNVNNATKERLNRLAGVK